MQGRVIIQAGSPIITERLPMPASKRARPRTYEQKRELKKKKLRLKEACKAKLGKRKLNPEHPLLFHVKYFGQWQDAKGRYLRKDLINLTDYLLDETAHAMKIDDKIYRKVVIEDEESDEEYCRISLYRL